MWSVVMNVRSCAGLAVGQKCSPQSALNLLNDWASDDPEVRDYNAVDRCLDGAELSEFVLYVRIDTQRQIIRLYEDDVRHGRKDMSYVKTARADFKSYLKLVEL
jgi:hypothetical protein